ncbi:MAG: hypothetical protein C4542_06235 [Dehalococcoidia bacterium]|nr:MAG: hypothetical protein C4542_06235 [Dehalococcoidia bacterium]
MAKNVKGQNEPPTLDNVSRRLDMIDERLDNIDSMVSAVIERVMNQALTIQTVCPHCGHNVEVALIGVRKPRG